MFIFDRSFAPVIAGLAVALGVVVLDRLAGSPGESESKVVVNMSRVLVEPPPPEVSSAPVRDLSLSCRLPPAVFADWLPSLKSRIVLDQVAARAPTIQPLFGMHSC